MKPEIISRFSKERYLLSLTEDDFRDLVVRPLLLRMGLLDGRDFCGPMEHGKDCAFVMDNPLQIREVWVVQTKRGNLNLGKKSNANVVEAATQMKTALATKVIFVATREKVAPSKVVLCASGKINHSAREYVVEQAHDPRVVFLDVDDLLPKIDKLFPELWLGIDANAHPYFRSLKKSLETATEAQTISDILPEGDAVSAATDKAFVNLQVFRTTTTTRMVRGKPIRTPSFEEFPVEGLLKRKENKILLLGDAGAGKSTTLKRLAYKEIERGLAAEKDKFNIPVILRAIDLGSETDFVDCLTNATKRVLHSDATVLGVRELQAGRVVAFIDALDELANDDARGHVLKLVDDFHTRYPSCKAIITSRRYSFVEAMPQLKHYIQFAISQINFKQVGQIIRRLHKEKRLPEETSTELFRRLQEVHGLELNPLLVTVFAATSEYGRQDVPANITELFKKYTEMMLGRWDATKGLRQQYHAPVKDFILCSIGFEMHRRKEISISEEEFKKIVTNVLETRGLEADLGKILEEILHRSGLLRVADGRVEFRHLLLQEFFAGRGIPNKDFLETCISSDWWRRAVVFFFGEHPGDFASLDKIRSVLSARPDFEVYQAAVTSGLALQACYLVEMKDKIAFAEWIVATLARTHAALVEADESLPMTRFLCYYVFGREAVALGFLRTRYTAMMASWEKEGISAKEKDLRTFWIIVGLLESGAMAEAEELLKSFKPADLQLLFAVHLGCYLIQNIRVSTKGDKRIAENICKLIAPKITHLRDKFIKEFSSELVEVRKGKVEALPQPKTEEVPLLPHCAPVA